MATVLKSITTFANLAVGVPTALPHGLVDAYGQGLVPDHCEDDHADIMVLSADAVNVIVRNDGLVPITAHVLCEHWHSENRALPPGQTDLPVQPFIPSSGSTTVPAHAVSHEDGGSDEIDVTNLSGVLADPQTPAAHATAHELLGADAIDGNHVATTLGTLTEAGGNVVPDLDAHGAVWTLTLTADGWVIGAPLNPTPGMTICFKIVQGGIGSYTVTWNAVWLWAGGGAAPTLSTAVGAIDMVSAMYDGTNWLANAVLDFQ
jgi:hypothetical protein